MMNPNQLRMLQQLMQAQEQNDEGLVHFKAGRMQFDEYSRMVTADKKPGKVKLVRAEDGVIHLQWQNRISGNVDLDVMLFPNTAVFEKVAECTDGRVFVLRMVQSQNKHFFWMQEASEEKDKEYLEKVNKLCRGESIGPENNAGGNNENNELNNLGLGGMGYSQQLQQAMLQSLQGGASNAGGAGAADPFSQLLRAFQNPANAGRANNSGNNVRTANTNTATTATTKPAGTGTGNKTQSQPQSQQSTLNPQANIAQMLLQAVSQNQRQEEMMMEQLKKEPNLTDILNASEDTNTEIRDLVLEDEKVCEELMENLPEEMKNREDIMEHINSPQFRGALVRLQQVINSPNMSVLLAQMGLQPENETEMGMNAFIRAIIKKYGPNNNEKNDENPPPNA